MKEVLKIAVSSGKGGTGKTFVATNLTVVLAEEGYSLQYLDCDVEAPNGHLFLKPVFDKKEEIKIVSPSFVDEKKCIGCGKCAKVCHYNAIAVVNRRVAAEYNLSEKKVLFFKELCHACGACKLVCPTGAIVEKERSIGILRCGKADRIYFCDSLLKTAEGGMSPRLVRKVKEQVDEGINIFDSPPGVACPVVETVKDTDLCILVTDPTPFGVNDLKLAVSMARSIGQEPVVVVNRADYKDSVLKDYCRKEGLEIIAEIPDDRKIAEIYSEGEIIVKKLSVYRELFKKLSQKVIELARKKRKAERPQYTLKDKQVFNLSFSPKVPYGNKPKELVVISGKGGTGKTSLVASFAALAANIVVADCDVDASDLHLVLAPETKEHGYFSGSVNVEIEQEKCIGCGRCKEVCRFSAIYTHVSGEQKKFFIDPIACEGCGACVLVCPQAAMKTEDAINGEWFISQTRFGPMSHARLGAAEENSGKLVTLVRNNACYLANKNGLEKVIIDGAPGTGCPVISSLTGADYALVVTEPTVSGMHDMQRVLKLIHHFKITSGVVVNKYDLNREMAEKIKNIVFRERVEFLGFLPYAKEVTDAQFKGLSVVEYTDTEVTKKIKSLWDKLKVYLY